MILEENNYYPFGLQHAGYNKDVKEVDFAEYLGYTNEELQNISEDDLLSVVPVIKNKYRYKYNGQEFQDELGLNWYTYRYRNFDPSTGRFFGIDPIAEDYNFLTPYQFAHNNPVWKIEIEGLEGEETTGWDMVAKGLKQKWNTIDPNQQMVLNPETNKPGVKSTREKAEQLAQGVNNLGTGLKTADYSKAGHVMLDAIGTAEPTPFADASNAVWYAFEGDWANASLSAISIIPYGGDAIAKTAKYGVKAINFSTEISKNVDSFYSVLEFNDSVMKNFELGGEIAMDGNHMTLNIAGYFQNSNNLEDIGSLGRENFIEIMDMLKGFAKAEGAEKVTIKYERSAGSTASKAGNAFERTFNLTD